MRDIYLKDVGDIYDDRIESNTGNNPENLFLRPPSICQHSPTHDEPPIDCHQQVDPLEKIARLHIMLVGTMYVSIEQMSSY